MHAMTFLTRTRAALACALVLALPPAHAAADAAVQQYQLDNGLTLIVKPDRSAPTAVQMLWVRVGSLDEENGTTG